MSMWEELVAKEAWEALAESYREAGGEDADDHTLAEMLRLKMIEVEG